MEIEDSNWKLPKFSTLFPEEKTGGIDPADYGGVCLEGMAIVEDIVQAHIFLYGIDLVDGSMIGELVRRSVGKHSNTLLLLRYNSQNCYISNINALFKAYRCLTCDEFIKSVHRLEQHLTTFKRKQLNMFFQRIYINCEKRFLTKKIRSISLNPMTKSSLGTWQYSILNQFVCRMTNSAIPITQLGSVNVFQYLHQFRPI